MEKKFMVEMEPGREGINGEPSVSAVYRHIWAKDGFPPPLPGLSTCWEIFSAACKENASRRMVGHREMNNGKAGKYVWQTYGEVYDQVLKIGAAMRACGVEPAGRCGIYATNCPKWVIAMEACCGHNIICVPLYDTLGETAVGYILSHAEISIVFVQDIKIPELLKSLHKGTGQVKTLVSFTRFTSEQEEEALRLEITVYSWEEFLKLGGENPTDLSLPLAQDISTIMYTSGTSGEPKGAILTHEALALTIAGAEYVFEHFDEKMTTDDVYLSFLPLAHIFDRIIEEFFFYRGASVGYWQGDPKLLAEDLLELKPTCFAGVPKVFDRIYAGATKTIKESRITRRMIFSGLYNYKLKWLKQGCKTHEASPLADAIFSRKIKARLGGRVRLILSGAAPLGNVVEEFLRVTLCCHVLQGYGLTETCGWSSVCLPDEFSMLGTVGPISPNTELRLESVPDMGYDALGAIPRGELCFRGKTLFSGYYKRDDLTKEAYKDGWFHTGDIGEVQPNGTLKIIDRKKSLFKLSQGEYIAVEHLENVYALCSYVEEIWIYGSSFESWLVAVVVPETVEIESWAKKNGLKGDFNKLCLEPKLKSFILEQLTDIAKKNNLKGFEYIKAIHIDPQPFDVERNLLTPTNKKKRPQMAKYYEKQIEEMYLSLKTK
ncbi:hypothetical protein SUGI_0091790 [Cryptomeria japonica]|uniref:long chain acyl-CoA synthetase 4 n=1 Tax=Cryptomeria japonica TaxID=3369 RepID=UPI002408E4CF|nr:long chain acyl-CoA synthetase 4 [Cryptomeria japonica]GLJ08586.1 hypothetical protein SUGI_0091790 [Cryptomeria japonica]